jgi:hypothetical protein
MKQFITFIIIISAVFTHGQDFGVGMWRDHLPYSNIIKVAKLDNLVYAASPYSMYTYDIDDESTERVSSVTGLSDFSINTIAVNEPQNTLIVGYENGNIDLIKDGVISNLNAIISSNIVGNRTIYNIHSEGKYSYLACGFGIVVLDLQKFEVKDTYIIGDNAAQLSVYDITINDNDIIAATEDGIYKADKNTPFLSDFNAWQKVTTFPNYDDSYEIVHAQNNLIYVGNKSATFSDDTVKVLSNNYVEEHIFSGDDYFAIEEKDNETMLIRNYKVSVYDQNHVEGGSIYTYAGGQVNPNHAIWDGSNFWIADRQTGLNKSVDNSKFNNYKLQGPLNNKCFHMSAKKDIVYVATGSVEGSAWNNTFDASGVMSFDQYDWKTYNRDYISDIDQTISFDFIYAGIDPKDENHALFCTFYDGLYEFQDGAYKAHYSSDNSELSESLSHSAGQTKVSCAAFDGNGNIWAANSFVSNPLVLITPDGSSSTAFNIGSAGSNAVITSMLIEKSTNNIWLTIRGKGVLVYNYNDTPSDASDDEYKLLTTAEGNGNIPSDNIHCIAEDHDGEIWIGTEKGPAVIYSPSAVFNSSSDFDAQQILIEQDGSFQYLLETQSISAIVVDGANRKWFGTSAGGIFLMSEDGTEEVEAHSTTNSPIFSDNVLSLAINEESGELFIGTDRGIIGYRGSAIDPKSDYNDVYSFPNPVKPGYTGPIAISGLKENSDIKIMDASGALVFSTTSLGGQAIWYGKDLYGIDVVSGIYFVMIVAEDGTAKSHTKIMIIR